MDPQCLQDSISGSTVQHPALSRLLTSIFSLLVTRLPWSPEPRLQLIACLTCPYPYPPLHFVPCAPAASTCRNPALLSKPWMSDLLNEPPQVLPLPSPSLSAQREPAQCLSQHGPALALAQRWPCLFLPPPTPRTLGSLKPRPVYWHGTQCQC